ncbi:protein of unknown function [Bartonella clarridgeiae 73]|uniref:Uncharacterized protein n=1 Tax=Bartonella clarridgeiae (strain CCUG 45776 / CIP 104772 / 73) TaxID=696125 RepID=E6YI79_BARC7|nr:protein of unknown function [Bartonella clarridgeiae 73]
MIGTILSFRNLPNRILSAMAELVILKLTSRSINRALSQKLTDD